MAHKYIEASRLKLQKQFPNDTYRSCYILNILISDRLTKSCFDLITPGKLENMDMLFNPKKTSNKEIVSTILQALATKFRSWSDQLKKSCNKPHYEYKNTSKGTVRIDKRIEPYGPIREKIENIDRAADILETLTYRVGKGGPEW